MSQKGYVLMCHWFCVLLQSELEKQNKIKDKEETNKEQRYHKKKRIKGKLQAKVSKETWCLTSTETIRLIRDFDGGF